MPSNEALNHSSPLGLPLLFPEFMCQPACPADVPKAKKEDCSGIFQEFATNALVFSEHKWTLCPHIAVCTRTSP